MRKQDGHGPGSFDGLHEGHARHGRRGWRHVVRRRLGSARGQGPDLAWTKREMHARGGMCLAFAVGLAAADVIIVAIGLTLCREGSGQGGGEARRAERTVARRGSPAAALEFGERGGKGGRASPASFGRSSLAGRIARLRCGSPSVGLPPRHARGRELGVNYRSGIQE